MPDIVLTACEEIVQADHIVPTAQQPLHQVGADKAAATGYQNSLQTASSNRAQYDA
jgi:hypothetical protein